MNVQAISNGQNKPEDKFNLLFDTYGKALKRKAYRILQDNGWAEDAVQLTFLKVLQNMDNVGEPFSERTRAYLFTILENTCYSIIKMNKKYYLMDDDSIEMDYSVRMVGKDHLMEGLIQEELLRDVKTLPDIYADIFIMYAFENYTLEEISDILGLKPATVRKRVQRGRELLIKAKIKDKYMN